ncbi:MAG: hypothetical protein ABMB14_30460 [Myxococcota bacterium]
MTAEITRVRVLVSLQRALLGEVFPSLRALTVEWGPGRVKFWAYVDGEPFPEDTESLSCVSAEVAGDFDADVAVEYEIVRRDAPAPIGDTRVFAYRRREQ